MASAPRLHSDLSALLGRLREDITVSLDPHKRGDRLAIEAFLDLANKRSDRYPALHAAMDRAGEVASVEPHELRIVDAGRTRSGQATTRAWHAPLGGAYLSGVTTLTLDTGSEEVLAVGRGTQVGGSRAVAATDPSVAEPAGDDVTALAFFHSQRRPGDVPRFGVTLDRREGLQQGSALDIQVSDPVKKGGAGSLIRIGLGRGKGKPEHEATCTDVDYCYIQEPPEPDPSNPTLVVPFVGQATGLPPIKGIDPKTGNVAGLVVSTELFAECSQKGLIKSLEDPTKLALKVTADAAGTGIGWKFPFDGKAQEKTESLRYGPGLWQYDEKQFAFVFTFQVPVKDPRKQYEKFSICSEDSPVAPSEKCKVIPRLTMLWHCLAAGTSITLEDGSERPIEEVTNAMRVRTGLGGSLGVEATTLGFHVDEDGPLGTVLRLVTEQGRELVLSALHPVITPMGPVAAIDLKPGAEVLVADGRDAVKSCERTSYEGLLFNLDLINSCDRANGLAPAFGSFLADGIAVGDHSAQEDHYRALRHDIDYMKPRLPEESHTDYESALADIVAG